MNEQEWLVSEDPKAMLQWLDTPASCGGLPWSEWKPSDRKLRLFTVACCRQVWGKLSDRCQKGVEVAERHADSRTVPNERGKAFNVADDDPSPTQSSLAMACLRARAREGATEIVELIKEWVSLPVQANLLREIVGNPYYPVTFFPGSSMPCGACNGSGTQSYFGGTVACEVCDGTRLSGKRGPCPCLTPTVLEMSRHSYDSKDFSNLPVIADALEEAGCNEEVLLRHLRGTECLPATSGGVVQAVVPVPLRCHHVIGCWAVDCLLELE